MQNYIAWWVSDILHINDFYVVLVALREIKRFITSYQMWKE